MTEITIKQEAVLTALKDLHRANEPMPTIREMRELLKYYGIEVNSTRSITQFLEGLEKKGLIARDGKPRGIYLTNKAYTIETPTVLEMYKKLERRVEDLENKLKEEEDDRKSRI